VQEVPAGLLSEGEVSAECLVTKCSLRKCIACKYFPEGVCSKEDCPYLPVKVSAKARGVVLVLEYQEYYLCDRD
jgi:hypothetical protein